MWWTLVKTTELVAAIDAELRAGDFQDGQHNGLQVEGHADTHSVVAAVSVNQDSIDQAIARGADTLLTHHGIWWHTDPMHLRGHRRRRYKAVLDADLNIVSYHLPLDAHHTLGNNAALADAAGCTEAAPAFPYKGGPTIGMIGTLSKPRDFSKWLGEFEDRLRRGTKVETGPFSAWQFGPDDIQRIGFVSGGAPYQVHDAIAAGCDVFVTGEAAEAVYHVAKEEGIHFVAGGHYLTERLGIQRLGNWVADTLDVEIAFVDVETEV